MHPEVVAGAALLAAGYVAAARRSGERLASARGAAFVLGLATLLGAVTGPLHDLAETALFSAHMLQHLLLTLVVPPCLLAGTPAPVLDALLAPGLRRRGLALLARTAVRPVPALGLHAVALIAWHLPGPYGLALESGAWHAVEHACLTGTALLAWWPVVSPSRRLPALHYAGRILYLFVFGMPMTVVAAMITAADHVLYPFYADAPRAFGLSPLEDQRIGGVLMWVPAGLVPLVAFTVVFFRWAAAEVEESPEERSTPAGGSR